ncbi:MAG: hypothetical protein IPF99_33425 [Deltaproteobacteria bacterium]|nr:hypothetical protein [Deltaproteobacteria bacterium]
MRPRFDACRRERAPPRSSLGHRPHRAASLDEAFLGRDRLPRALRRAEAIARTLRQRIRDELHLPASAGVAPVKFVAKIGSDLAKPDGFRVVRPGEARRFLAPLSVARLWGVGPATHRAPAALGPATIDDIARRDRDELVRFARSAGGAPARPLPRHRPQARHARPRREEHRRRGHFRRRPSPPATSSSPPARPGAARRPSAASIGPRRPRSRAQAQDPRLRAAHPAHYPARGHRRRPDPPRSRGGLVSREDELGGAGPDEASRVSAVLPEAPTVQPGLFRTPYARRATKLNGALTPSPTASA